MTERRMKDSGIPWIGMIPEEWEVCRFKDTHNGTNVGESIDKQYWIEDISFIPFYSASITPMHTNYKDFPKWKYTKCEDLLLSRNGTPYVYLPIVNAAYTDHIIRVSIKNYFNKKFVKYCIEQSIQSVVVNTVSLATWSASIWNEQKIPLPSLAEQEAIAGWLDGKCGEVDELIEVEQKMIEELEAYRQATITETVTRGLNPDAPMRKTNNSWISEIPEHWKICRLKDLCEYIKDGTHFSPATTSEGFPYITASDVHGLGIDFSRTKRISENDFLMLVAAGCAPQKGDVLIVKDGATTGRTGILTSNDKCVLLSSVAMLKAICSNYWLMYLLSSDLIQDQILLSMAGSAMPRITLTKLNNFIGLWIPSYEQCSIASYLDAKCKEIDDLNALKREKIETLKQYRQSIIFEAVTGKIQIN